MGRPRNKERTGWPANLYRRVKSGRVYYKYKLQNGKYRSVGSDLDVAKAVAEQLNAKRASIDVKRVISRVLDRKTITIEDHAKYVLAKLADVDQKNGKKMSATTLYEYSRMYKSFAGALPGVDVGEITRKQVSAFLDKWGTASRHRYHTNLSKFFVYAVSRGLRSDNPLQFVITHRPIVSRVRLTHGEFSAIYDKAPPWLQVAMDVAYLTAQSPVDVCKMRWSDIEDGTLRIVRQKVEQHEHSGYIALKIGPKLQAVLDRSRALEPLDSPYIAHIDYVKKSTPDHFAGKLTRQYVSRAFRKIREDLGLFAQIDPKDRPSFGEIRALKADQIRVAESVEEARKMLGHASVEMTKKYLERHGERWEAAESD